MVVRVNFHVADNRNVHYREMFIRAGDAASVPVVECHRTECDGCGHGYGSGSGIGDDYGHGNEHECDGDCGSDHEAVAQSWNSDRGFGD
ncbi:hypothetical protein PC128_g5805 [Phytophthora cactorum]|nr:hypothetical protein PC128_g5805 [Phytophthora cactorum]